MSVRPGVWPRAGRPCCSACASSCARRGEPVATLIDTQGTVERNDGAQAWSVAGAGRSRSSWATSSRPPRTRRRACGSTNGTVIRVPENARIRFARGTLPNAKGRESERRARFGGGRSGDRRGRAGDGARRRADRARRPGAGFVGRRARGAGGRRRPGGAAPSGRGARRRRGQGREDCERATAAPNFTASRWAPPIVEATPSPPAPQPPRRLRPSRQRPPIRQRRRPPRPRATAGRAPRTAART